MTLLTFVPVENEESVHLTSSIACSDVKDLHPHQNFQVFSLYACHEAQKQQRGQTLGGKKCV